MRLLQRPIRLVLLLSGSALLAWIAWLAGPGAVEPPLPIAKRYRMAAVERGTLEQVVSANGTLNPVTLVNVGTQISGTIRAVKADFNEQVEAGQVLAEIDPALIEAQIAQLEANLAEARAQLGLAERRLRRTEDLIGRGFVSGAQADDDRQSVATAQARVRAIEAQVERERTNLGYTVIRSPIDGVVVARTVDVGQTVAASFQTPQLFLIARDLRDMQIDTNVSEADVGALRVGMQASFRVDALGDRSFDARVRQVRLNPKIEQTVVTYNVVLATRNDDGRLLPGMTASVRIRVAGRDDVLRIPNTALRFRPSDPEAVVSRPQAGGDRGDERRGERGSDRSGDRSSERGGERTGQRDRTRDASPAETRRGFVHVETVDDGRPALARIPVRLGVTDGMHTEVIEDGTLKAGDRVALGEIVQPAGGAGRGRGFQLRLF